jgi:hypothetical protein
LLDVTGPLGDVSRAVIVEVAAEDRRPSSPTSSMKAG